MTSTIKVDNINKVSDGSNIIKKCGSTVTIGSGSGQTIVADGATVTLGRCGGAVNLAPGATQTGFGRTGTVDWCTTAKTSPFTSENGRGYFLNTNGGAITVTLPASPSQGSIVAFKDYNGTWNVACKNVTLGRNGSKINGTCGDGQLTTQHQSITLVYVDGVKGWQEVHDSSVGFTGNIQYNVEVFAVAGGGGANGPPMYGGGGAGAGGFRNIAAVPVGSNCGPYTVQVGGGGAGAPITSVAGENSIFSTVTSAGGGIGGDAGPGGAGSSNGGDGGSGGGGVAGTGGAGNTPNVSPPQGNDGGPGLVSSGNVRSGGGGGAGAAGQSGACVSTNQGGNGGAGAPIAIFGSLPQAPTYGTPGPAPGRYFAGGGAGRGGFPPSPGSAGTGGVGGGGGGATNGTTNTGGGGGANRAGVGGSGGSGIVVLKHATSDATPAVAGGNVVLTCGSNTIRIFTADGTFTP